MLHGKALIEAEMRMPFYLIDSRGCYDMVFMITRIIYVNYSSGQATEFVL